MIQLEEVAQEKKLILKRLMDYMVAYDKEKSESFREKLSFSQQYIPRSTINSGYRMEHRHTQRPHRQN